MEEGKPEEALKITRDNCDRVDFVQAKDETTKSNGGGAHMYINCFEYRYRKQPREGFTLLHYAVLYNQVEVMKVLIQHGAGLSNRVW